jgi:diacylglycerol O-acyltransferase / wax synthase
MRRLTPIDMAFLLAERRHQPLHVGALSLFHPPEGAPPDFVARIAGRLRQSRQASGPFNRRLSHALGIGSWVESADFDLEQHFVHLSLPQPGRIRELLSMVSRIHSAHLDRAYPLWRTYLIEGLDDGRIALYSKIHHAVVDGVAGIRLMLRSMSDDADTSLKMAAPWELRQAAQTAAIASASPATSLTPRALLTTGLRGAPAVFRQLLSTVRDIRSGRGDVVTSFQAPRCILNQPITGSRRFAAQSYSAARIRALAQQLDATANDIVLSLCGAALRRYLLEHDALPERPLIACVPVSIRRDEGIDGNQVTLALANLGTQLADPLARVAAVKASMDRNKAVFSAMTPAQLLAYSLAMLAPGALTLLPGLGAQRTVANVVISHVPGPRQDMYWQGCKLDGVYPASLVLDGFALNITLVSRHDRVDVGILACRRTLPGMQRLLDYIESALSELEFALGMAAAAVPGISDALPTCTEQRHPVVRARMRGKRQRIAV